MKYSAILFLSIGLMACGSGGSSPVSGYCATSTARFQECVESLEEDYNAVVQGCVNELESLDPPLSESELEALAVTTDAVRDMSCEDYQEFVGE